MLRKHTIRVLWLASVIVIVVLSLKPQAAPPMSFAQIDKVAHCIAYAWLAGLVAYAWTGRQAIVRVWLVLALGVALEFGQILVPGRSFSLLDMGANAVGVCLGWWLGSRMADRRRRLRTTETA